MARIPDTTQLYVDGVGGANSYAEIDNDLWSSTITAFTFWCRSYRNSTSGNRPIFGNFTANPNRILFRTGATNLQLYIRNSAGSQFGPATVSGASTGSWLRVAARWDGSNLNSWLNGTKSSDVSATGNFTTTSVGPMRFGYTVATTAPAPDAYFREAAFWSGVALPDGAIASLDAGAHPLMFAPSNYWPLDGDGVDLVGGNNVGTLGSGASWSTAITPPKFVSLPIGPIYVRGIEAAVGGGTVPPLMYHHRHHNQAA